MTAEPSELAHPVRLDRITRNRSTVTLRPGGGVRAALAARFGLVSVDAFAAELTVHRRPESGWIEVAGTLSAEVVQTCVVTTEPVPAVVRADVMELFDDSADATAAEVDLDPMAETPEPISGDSLDIGEIAAQAFGLALDPYPRAEGLDPVEMDIEGDAPNGRSPFARLAALKAPGGGKV